MNRAEIQPLLTQFTPLEQEFCSAFQKSGCPITEGDFLRLINRHKNLPRSLKDEFQPFSSTGSKFQASAHPSDRQFSDAEWFLDTEDISVRKHPRYSPAFEHSHSFIEISYVLSGSCQQTFYFSNTRTEQRTFSSGTVCILPPKLKHAVSVFDDSIVINILIRTSAMKHTLSSLVAGNHALFDFFLYTLYENEQPNYLLFLTNESDSIRDLILDMIAESCSEKQYSQKALLLMLGLFFTYLQRDYSDDMRFSHATSAGLSYIPRVLNYIQENYADASVEDIAAVFSVSPSYLGRIFRENTQTTVIETIRRTRIQQACELLTSTTLPVQNISEAVGYSNVTHFIRIFRQYNGTTPLQYRKQHMDF